jgi:hypothetical protein
MGERERERERERESKYERKRSTGLFELARASGDCIKREFKVKIIYQILP